MGWILPIECVECEHFSECLENEELVEKCEKMKQRAKYNEK